MDLIPEITHTKCGRCGQPARRWIWIPQRDAEGRLIHLEREVAGRLEAVCTPCWKADIKATLGLKS